jgi:hypothetical protein
METMKSERGAETVEVIIGIVVFVVFGLAVFGVITRSAGNKMADTANCLKDSGTIISSTATTKDRCKSTDTHTYKYN